MSRRPRRCLLTAQQQATMRAKRIRQSPSRRRPRGDWWSGRHCPGRNTPASSPALSDSRTTGRGVGRPAGSVGSDVGAPASGSGVITPVGSTDTSSASTVSASPAAGSTASFGICGQPEHASKLGRRQLVCSISAVSNRRAWIAGYTAAARANTITVATPVRSASSATPQSILMP